MNAPLVDAALTRVQAAEPVLDARGLSFAHAGAGCVFDGISLSVRRREIVALSESKRTESYWVRSRIYDPDGQRLRAEVLLNHATLKHSYAGYEDAA